MSADKAIKLMENEFPDCSWELCRITNERHTITPYGAGVSITLIVGQLRVWEKAKSNFLMATHISSIPAHVTALAV